jgi:flagellar FliJ protein
MLADLQALSALDAETARQAAEDFNAARAQTKGLEKLQEKHQSSVAAGELAAEQVAVDEIASGSWHREHEGVSV